MSAFDGLDLSRRSVSVLWNLARRPAP